jgi:flagellar hook-length control protein FliK
VSPAAGTAGAVPAVTAGNGAGIAAPASASPGVAAPAAAFTPATPSALAASVVAMCRTGQSSLVLRLDPPGLGTLSVHVAMGSNAEVNVLFVPAVAQTAHLIHGALSDLRDAMATSGLTLGQAQIGGGSSSGSGSSSGGGNAGSQSRNAAAPAAGTVTPMRAPEPSLQEAAARGLRAVA